MLGRSQALTWHHGRSGAFDLMAIHQKLIARYSMGCTGEHRLKYSHAIGLVEMFPGGGSGVKKMKIRRSDRCRGCGIGMAAGTEAYWDPTARVVRCLACGVAPRIPDTPAQLLEDDSSIQAGASARREHQRRSERERVKKERVVADDLEWRRSQIESRPLLGRVAAALTPKPVVGPESQPTRAWKVGAEGEERVAEVLATASGVEVLHDRRVPRSRANIDHIVVGPAGIYVIDAKKYKQGGAIEVRDVGTWRNPDQRLYVDGRHRTNLVDGVIGQIEIVRAALGLDLKGVPIHGVLCFVGATWGLRKKPKSVKGVTAIWPKALPGFVTQEGPHAIAVERIAGQLRSALPPAIS